MNALPTYPVGLSEAIERNRDRLPKILRFAFARGTVREQKRVVEWAIGHECSRPIAERLSEFHMGEIQVSTAAPELVQAASRISEHPQQYSSRPFAFDKPCVHL